MKLEMENASDQNRISQPKDHRGRICLWADLSVNDVDELFNAWSSPNKVKELLGQLFSIDTNSEDVKSAILLDLYYYTLQFAKESEFNVEQTSAFFSMVKQSHQICVETPFDNFDACFTHFKEQLLCHAVRRPPYSLDLFTPEQVRLVSEYVITTYFRHYKMYKYAFTPMVRLDLSMTYTGMPVTPPPSEAGDVAEAENEAAGGEGLEETAAEGGEEEEKTEEATEQQASQEDESPAAKDLRAMIKQHLEDEMRKLRLSMEEQLKLTEEGLNKKLNVVEGNKQGAGKGGRGSAKGARGSAKGKKK